MARQVELSFPTPIEARDPETCLAGLNPVQREAVLAVEGPVMILAGAGSGKTRVLTHRIAHLVGQGVPPSSILALTFTNKAAREMRDRVEGLVSGSSLRAMWIGTFHGMFARMLRSEAEHLGFTKNFTIYDTEDAQSLIRGLLGDHGLSAQQITPSAIHSRISFAKNQLRSPADLANEARDGTGEKVARIFESYQQKLREANAMDFDDLILHPIALFDAHPDILERYRRRFRHILIDEYQDTNQAQFQIVKRLVAPDANVCVVGDDSQSIYAFRGADIRNILTFQRQWPEVRTFRLEQNYRSTGNILKAADSLIKNNAHRMDKTLWTENPTGDPIHVVEAPNEQEEALRIVRLMQEESHRQKLQLRDFAVLYRTNAQSRAIEDALRRNGIPYTIIGGIAFYKRKEIKDILAYLKLFVNPQDNEAFLRVVNVPLRGIGQTSVGRLKEWAGERGETYLEAASRAGDCPSFNTGTSSRFVQFAQVIRKYRSLKDDLSAGELTAMLINELGLVTAYKEEGTQESRTRLENLMELQNAITEYRDAEGRNDLESFLTEAALVADVDAMDPDRNAVTLMTLHAAKGLEFPVVFLAGMEEGLFPSMQSIDSGDVEEERRLCYVGMTRAMRTLFLLYARSRTLWGERQDRLPSRFLHEIDPTVVTLPASRRTATPSRPTSSRTGTHARRPASEYRQASVDDYSQVEPELVKGTKVVHASFGRGTVLALEGGGPNAKAVVFFDSVGKKTLVLRYANLQIAS